jgi:hypothetical protein
MGKTGKAQVEANRAAQSYIDPHRFDTANWAFLFYAA